MLVASSTVLALCGCAAPPSPQQYTQSAASLKQERDVLRADLAERKTKRSKTSLQSEIDRLNDEVHDLESRIAALEGRIRTEELRAKTQYIAPTSSSGCITGARGGSYTITKSGKKNYGGC